MELLKHDVFKQIAQQECAQEKTLDTCRIRARNDVEAIERWLDEYFDKATTFRSYKKEAERFLVWCVSVQQKGLQEIDRDDVEAYLNFLRDPQPREIWCGPRGGKKNSKGEKVWFPFAGPLSASAIKTTLASLNSLMSYLVDAGYAHFNPFSLIRRKSRFKDQMNEQALLVQERILQEPEWQEILKVIEHPLPTNFIEHRRNFLVKILFFLGLRIDELARSIWSSFRKIDGRWWFFVKGKGDRLGKIPVGSRLLAEIMTYRRAQNLSSLPQENDESAIICSAERMQGLSTRQMSNIIKEVALRASEKFPKESASHVRLKKFSPHWLRHLSASRQDLAGISFTNIKANLRHLNEQTTRQYVHAQDDQRHREMERLSLRVDENN